MSEANGCLKVTLCVGIKLIGHYWDLIHAIGIKVKGWSVIENLLEHVQSVGLKWSQSVNTFSNQQT